MKAPIDQTERTEYVSKRPLQEKKKGLPVPPGVKLNYFGRPGPNHAHQGVVTVAWIEPSPGLLHLSFSFCSPGDKWCKITGRDMALARLLHPVVIPFLYSPKRTVHEVVRAVLTHDFIRIAALAPGATMLGSIPSWTKDLAKRLMGGTERERRGRGKTLGEKLAWLRAQGLNLNPSSLTSFPFSIASLDKFFRPPLEVELPLTIITRMMRDIAALGNH